MGIMNMNSFYGKGPNMHQLMDLFAVPEMTLFSNVIQVSLAGALVGVNGALGEVNGALVRG